MHQQPGNPNSSLQRTRLPILLVICLIAGLGVLALTRSIAIARSDQPDQAQQTTTIVNMILDTTWGPDSDANIVAWGDMDNDGDLDLAVGNDGQSNRVYLNEGGFLQNAPAWESAIADHTTSLAWGDMDGDGDLDLAVGNYGQNSYNQVYENIDGMLETTPAIIFYRDVNNHAYTNSVAWGDMDGDGDLDLAVGNQSSGSLYPYLQIFPNENGALLITPTLQIKGLADTRSVAWGDVDSDGDLDLAVGNYNQFSWVFVNMTGTLSTTPAWTSDDLYTTFVAWSDVDGDGMLDLTTGGLWDGSNLNHHGTYLNYDGLPSPYIWNWGLPTSNSLDWGDADNDGDLDLVMAGGNKVEIWLANETHSPVQDWMADISNAQSVAWGDVDGDGDLDLAVAVKGGPSRLYHNDLANYAEAGAACLIYTWEREMATAAWGDVDNDGDLDLALGMYNDPNMVMILHNRIYFSQYWEAAAAYDTRSLAWGDMNGDGLLDLAVGNFNQPNLVYLNTGATLATTPAWTAGLSEYTYSLAWGDVNGDDYLDLAVANSQANRVYLNQNGTLQTTPAWSSPDYYGYTKDLAWGDVDNDGDLDLAVINTSDTIVTNHTQVYLNVNGMLQDTPAWTATDPSSSASSLAWGDVDGDGDLDLAVGSTDTASSSVISFNRVYLNASGTLQTTPYWKAARSASTREIDLIDIDNDGALDMPVRNDVPVSDRFQIYPNLGKMLFPIPRALDFPSTGYFHYSIWGDLTGDSFPDIAFITEPYSLDGTCIYAYAKNRPAANPRYPFQAPDGLALDYTHTPAAGYATAQSWGETGIPFSYTISSPSGVAPTIRGYYSLNGGGQWLPARPMTGTITDDLLVLGSDLAFDGAVDYAQKGFPYSPQPSFSNMTIEFWFNSTQVISETEDNWKNGSGLFYAYHIYGGEDLGVSLSKGKVLFGSGNSGPTLTGPFAADGRWHHVAATWQASNGAMQLYLDGNLVGAGAGSTATRTLYYFYLGKHIEEDFYQGQLDEVRLWSTVRTQEEIQTYMHRVLPIDSPGLFAYYQFNEPTGQISVDNPMGNRYLLDSSPNRNRIETYWRATRSQASQEFVYRWDIFGSGIFGRNDNVAFRLYAQPNYTARRNNTPGPFQRPALAASTHYTFRVHGSQVRVMQDGVPVSGAMVYRIPQGSTQGSLYTDLTGQPYQTSISGYLGGFGTILPGDTLIAMKPISDTERYTLYITSGVPTMDTLQGDVVEHSGVQTLTVSTGHPLLVFNLDISLEWDASENTEFLTRLEDAIQKTSTVLFDITDGQVALGKVRIFQNRENWLASDVVIYAQTGIRPRASMGGVVENLTDDLYHDGRIIDNAYGPGQIRMGTSWDPFGASIAELTVDWQRALAHELSHYLLYLPDNYLGVGSTGAPISTDCLGSFMTNTYDEDYSEFLTRPAWLGECTQTIAQNTTGRVDWETVTHFYPALLQPVNPLAGPAVLPLAITRVEFVPPEAMGGTLPGRFYDVRNAASGLLTAVPRAQAFIYQDQGNTDPTDDKVLPMGSTLGDGDRVKVNGAGAGNRLCLFGPPDPVSDQSYSGCIENLSLLNTAIPVSAISDWQPNIIVRSVTSVTLEITVTLGVPTDTLHMQFFPAYGLPGAGPQATLAPTSAMTSSNGGLTHTYILTLTAPAFEGWLRVWIPEAQPVREAMSQIFLSPPWGPNSSNFDGGADTRSWGANNRQLGAPVASGDGQVSIFNFTDIFSDTGTVSLQSLNNIPSLPSWLTQVGQAYRFTANQYFPRAIAFDYLQKDIPPGYEDVLAIYYSPDEGATWKRLPTQLETQYNRATAIMPHDTESPQALDGQGIYALVTTIEMPALDQGWNLFAYPLRQDRPVGLALASITDKYTSVYWETGDEWLLYDTTVLRDHTEFAGLINTLSEFQANQAYWIYATEPVTPYLGVPSQSSAAMIASLNLPPATYYGWVLPWLDFSPQPGDSVSAWINGNQCGSGSILELNGNLVYRLQVAADNGNGCGAAGRQVIFRVGEFELTWNDQLWDNSQAQFLTLGPPDFYYRVRVMQDGSPVQGAVVYRVPQSESHGSPYLDLSGEPYQTNLYGYLPGAGLVQPADNLFALLPVTVTDRYTLYATNAIPMTDTLQGYTVQQSGVQTITVSAEHPLLAFNLNVSLEWDARNDGDFLQKLATAIQQASALLFDVSNGQIVIGNVNIFQERQNWLASDVVIYAQTSSRPRSSMGGLVEQFTNDLFQDGRTIPKAYVPGQIRIGPNWDSSGSSIAELTADWQHALAHHLAHYLLFLPDNYLGIGEASAPIPTNCQGSFMTNFYDNDYSEFLSTESWTGECLDTIAAKTTGRFDWETVINFYPGLVLPSASNPGPAALPLDILRVNKIEPGYPVSALPASIFDMRLLDSGLLTAVPHAQAFVFQGQGTVDPTDDRLIHLGSSLGNGSQVKVRGARPGDRLCLFGESYAGCVANLSLLNTAIPVSPLSDWQPDINARLATSTTLQVTVSLSVPTDTLHMQFFPAYGAAGMDPGSTVAPTTTLTHLGSGVYTATLTLPAPAFEGWLRVWIPSAQPVHEAMSQLFLSPPDKLTGNTRAWGASRRQIGAPVASGDGQVSIFSLTSLISDTASLSLQSLNHLPSLPVWLTQVGQAYRFAASEPFPRAIVFDYLQTDAPLGYEYTLTIYYSPDDGLTWQRLPTQLDMLSNRATASMPGNTVGSQGIYALVATIEMPALVQGWNLFAYTVPEVRPVDLALASISGKYTSVYLFTNNLWTLFDATVVRDHPEFTGLVNDLYQMQEARSYWIYATEPVTPYLGIPSASSAALAPMLTLPPATYYGWVQPWIDFLPAPGDPVTAWIDGNLCGSGSVVELNGQMAYKIQVAADAGGNGCGAAGRKITFRVGEHDLLTYNLTWDNSQAWFYSLTPPIFYNFYPFVTVP